MMLQLHGHDVAMNMTRRVSPADVCFQMISSLNACNYMISFAKLLNNYEL